MERLTMCIDSHLLDNGKLDKEYYLNNKIQFNEYSCMDIPKAVYNKLGELEDVLEEHLIENADTLNLLLQSIENINIQNDNLRNELAELKQKAIVPKFNFNQEIYFIDEVNQIVRAIILAYDYYDKRYLARLLYFQEEQVWLYEEYIFATREEAEQKLAEIRGKDE